VTLPGLPPILFRSPERLWIAAPVLLLLLLAPLLARPRLREALLPFLLRALAAASLLLVLLDPVVEEERRVEGRLLALVDVSPSVGASGRAEARDRILARGAAALDVAAFGALPRMEEAPFGVLPGEDPAEETDLGAALGLALARSGGAPLGVWLLSDGRATRPGARSAAEALRARGIALAATPTPRAADGPAPERAVLAIELPPEEERARPFAAAVRIRASGGGPARLRLFLDGRPVSETAVAPGEGERLVATEPIEAAPGRHLVQAEIDGDLAPADDLLGLEFTVPRTPRVLLLAAAPRRSFLAQSLLTQGIEAEVLGATAEGGPDLAGYDAVVLLPDAPVEAVVARTGALTEFLGRGGGLLAVGGRDGPGLARFHGTPVAFLLPLDVPPRPPPEPAAPPKAPAEEPRIEIVEEKKQAYPVSLCLLLDRSLSMGEEDKLRRAKEAALAAATALTPEDRISVIAFNEKPALLLAPRAAGRGAPVAAAIQALEPQGQTGMFQALAAGLELMRTETAPIRHLVLLSDGISTDEGPWRDLLKTMSEEKVTLSTVGVGFRIDQRLPTLARWGQGKFWIANHPHEIPQVVTQDTRDLLEARGRRGRDAERPAPKPPEKPPPPKPEPEPPAEPPRPPRGEPLVADPLAPREALLGVEDGALPTVHGFEEGTPRLAAWVAARAGAEGPPVLAYHRAGLGTVAALAIDPDAAASGALREHREAGRILAQLLRSILPDAPREAWRMEHRVAGGGNDDRLEIRLLGEDGLARTDPPLVVFVEGAPARVVRRADRYEAILPRGTGPQTVSVSVGEAQETRVFRIPRSLPAERAAQGPDLPALRAIVGHAGRLDPDPASIAPPPPNVGRSARPYPLPFLLFAAILLPFDAWARRSASASR